MRRSFSTSIRQLTLIGFLLVVLPLVIALISTFVQAERLSREMQAVIRNSAHAVEFGRIIPAQILSMERTAGQYRVLLDASLLERYRQQRDKLSDAMEHFSALPLDPSLSSQLNELEAAEARLYEKITALDKETDNADVFSDELDQMNKIAQSLPLGVSQLISGSSQRITRRVENVQRMLIIEAAALAPLALAIAAYFSMLISRPLKQLGKAIRRLGAGKFDQPVSVSGPNDIREIGERLDWLRQRLAELDEQKLMFLHHVSHELKTPLTALREGVGLLEDEVVGQLNPEQTEVAQILNENTAQLQEQVEALLNFNIALAQKALGRREKVAVSGVIDSVVKKHALALRSRNIRVITQLQPLVIEGEKDLLTAIVDNLLSNAVKYSPDNGVIRVRLARQDENLLLKLQDEGPGIPQEDREHIFKPFYQGRILAGGHIKGTGLGLAIAHRYAEMHGGTISVIDSDNGTTMQVSLPLAAANIIREVVSV